VHSTIAPHSPNESAREKAGAPDNMNTHTYIYIYIYPESFAQPPR
jgi:hypothetical protein